jgi:hypothetical protein
MDTALISLVHMSDLEYLHPRIFRCGYCLVYSCCPILPSLTCSMPAVLRLLHGSAVSSSQPRMAVRAIHWCSSTTPGPTAALHAPLPLAMCLGSTSHSRDRSRYRVPGFPNLVLWMRGSWLGPWFDSGARLLADQSRAEYSMAVEDSGRRARSPLF